MSKRKNYYKYLTFIPARSGSVGIKNKNIKKIGNLTLIEHTVNFAKKFSLSNNYIFLSTDSKKYAKIATNLGARVPFLRSKKISKSNSNIGDAILEFLDWNQKNNIKLRFEYLILLLPTQPFRKLHDLKKGIELFKKKVNTVLSVKNLDRANEFIFKIRNNTINFKKNRSKAHNRQFVKTNFTTCGCFYLTRFSSLINSKTIYNSKIMTYETKFPNNLDIDSFDDLRLANLIYKNRFFK